MSITRPASLRSRAPNTHGNAPLRSASEDAAFERYRQRHNLLMAALHRVGGRR